MWLKQTKDEKKFKTLEEKGADALEVAAKKDEKGKEKKTAKIS